MLMYVPKGKKGKEERACCCRQVRGNAGVLWGCLLVVVPAGGICWWLRLLMVATTGIPLGVDICCCCGDWQCRPHQITSLEGRTKVFLYTVPQLRVLYYC